MLVEKKFFTTGIFLGILFAAAGLQAEVVEYDLTIAEQEVDITGEPSKGMTINGTIPGSTQDGSIRSTLVETPPQET